MGVANPRPTAPLAMADPGAVLREDDYLPCLFFADDGVLIALDRETLQAMTDFLAESLAEVGLFLNAGKTKWMVVAPADMPREAYHIADVVLGATRTPIDGGRQDGRTGRRVSLPWRHSQLALELDSVVESRARSCKSHVGQGVGLWLSAARRIDARSTGLSERDGVHAL